MQIWNGSDEYCWRYRADTILSTDGQTDGRTDRQGDTSIPPYQLRWSGGYNELTAFFLDSGHQAPYSPYKPCNHNLYIGIIIFPHIDNTKYIFFQKLHLKMSQINICHVVQRTKVDSLWPSNIIWHQRSSSTLVQIMACCLTTPSHYQSQSYRQ